MRRQESGFVTLNALALALMLGLAIMSLLQQDCCNPPCPVTPSIQVLIPNGGNAWGIGTTGTIQWISGNVSGNVRIELSRDFGNDDTWETIADNVPNNNGVPNSAPWLVNDPPSTSCVIRITAVDGSAFDISDQLFTIGYAPPSLTLTAPVGGAIWEFNTVENIRWNSVLVSNVKIELSRDGGASFNTLAASVPSAPSSYPWTVTDPFTSQARIRISAVENPSVYATTPISFTIQPSLRISGTVFFLTSTTVSTQTLGPTQLATLNDGVALTATVNYGAGFQPGWQITVQAMFGKSDPRITYTLGPTQQTLSIPNAAAGTLTFTFPLTVGTESYGGRITGHVSSPNTANGVSSNLACLSCDAICHVLTAQIDDFQFLEKVANVGQYTLTLTMKVRYWSPANGYRLKMTMSRASNNDSCVITAPTSDDHYANDIYQTVGTINQDSGLTTVWQRDVSVNNTCQIGSTLTYSGYIPDTTEFPYTTNKQLRAASLPLRIPDHLVVESDVSQPIAQCPDTLIRFINLRVVDSNDNHVGLVRVREQYLSITQNTCGNGMPTPTPCLGTDTNTSLFTDIISVNCNGVGGPCGYNIIHQWQACPVGRPAIPLGTLSDSVHADQIIVNGVSTPGSIPRGTKIYP